MKIRRSPTVARLALTVLVGVSLASLGLFAWLYQSALATPVSLEVLDKYVVPQTTVITDREGNQLYELYDQGRRTLVPLSEISPHLQQAVIAAEDKRFYTHRGLDYEGIARAAWLNARSKLRHEQRPLQGGSTITQQLIKNTLLTTERTWERKLKEAVLAPEVEKRFTKEQILERYLNIISFGNQALGAQEAALTYFNKPAKELTLSESATLAALPQLPSYYSPYGPNLEKLFARKDYILDQMAELGYVTAAEAAEAKRTTPYRDDPSFHTYKVTLRAPHAVWYARDQLLKMAGGAPAASKIAESGYRVTTTIDPHAQQIAEEIIQKHRDRIARLGAHNAALIALDTKTGEVLALVGSVDYQNEEWGSVNVAERLRPPGSSIKPIVYAAAFQGHFGPATVIKDEKVKFVLTGNQVYEPENYTKRHYGNVTVRQALNLSLNIPPVKIVNEIGSSPVLQTARSLGLSTLDADQPEKYGLSLALGAYETRLDELTNAYATFGNGGRWNPIRIVKEVSTPEGEPATDLQPLPESHQAIDPQVAFLVSDTLADTEAERSLFGRTLVIKNRPVAVKTGTSQDVRDAWAVGYTPQIAVGVWVGNNDNSPLSNLASGSIAAVPIWKEFIERYLDKAPVEPFTPPAGVEQVVVDRFTGKLTSFGCSRSAVKEWFASWNIPKERQACRPPEPPAPEPGAPVDENQPVLPENTPTTAAVGGGPSG